MDFGFFTHDVVRRGKIGHGQIGPSPALRRGLLEEADREIRRWLGALGFDARAAEAGPADVAALEQLIERAQRLRLFTIGGVPVRNFTALALINHYLHPRLYIESGYFTGSSIFAAFFNKRLERVIGFDPVPSNYRIDRESEAVRVDRRQTDFATYEGLDVPAEDALAYFDDHINTAARILQSAEKGLLHVIFDDSCGVNGTCQRLWPSMPTLFFIRRHKEIAEGERLSWEHHPASNLSLRSLGKRLLGRSGPTRLECRFDDKMLELCREADECIAAVHKIPDLSDFIFDLASPTVETTQHFVVLKRR